MRAIWSGSISFGLVNIPVKLYSGTESNTLDLDMFSKDDHCPIVYKRVCRDTGKEVPYDDIVKGYEYKDGDYVLLDKKDFKDVSKENPHTIEISEFVEESEIDSVYYEKVYYLEPQKSAKKSYALLRDAITKSGKVGFARYMLRNRQQLGVVKVFKDILIVNQVRYSDEVRAHSGLDIPGKVKIAAKEVDTAVTLIDSMTAKFKPSKYKDTYNEDLMKVIKKKAKGKKTTVRAKKAPKPTKAKDIMTLLKKSISEKKKSAA
jgi:DNA end-binding protein Ku